MNRMKYNAGVGTSTVFQQHSVILVRVLDQHGRALVQYLTNTGGSAPGEGSAALVQLEHRLEFLARAGADGALPPRLRAGALLTRVGLF